MNPNTAIVGSIRRNQEVWRGVAIAAVFIGVVLLVPWTVDRLSHPSAPHRSPPERNAAPSSTDLGAAKQGAGAAGGKSADSGNSGGGGAPSEGKLSKRGQAGNDDGDPDLPPKGGMEAARIAAGSDAAQSLRRILSGQKMAPGQTMSITISTGGGIKAEAPTGATVFDGLPSDALRGSLAISGGKAP